MLTRSQPVDSDDFGETIARFAAPAERSFLERRGAAELQMRRIALMTRAQRLYSPESTVVDVRPAQAQPRWARARRVTLWSCWAPRVPRLQVSRGVTELCWRLATERVQYVQKTRVFSGDIRENLG